MMINSSKTLPNKTDARILIININKIISLEKVDLAKITIKKDKIY